MHRYEAGETTQQIGTHYDISKTRVSTEPREQGIIIRRQGLNDDQVDEAAQLCIVGRSPAATVASRAKTLRGMLGVANKGAGT